MINSTTNTFGYNSKSELIEAALGLDDYGYDYDQIGNRITATSSVDSVTSEMDYLCNALNQYTNIVSGTTESPTYDSDGNMLTNGNWTAREFDDSGHVTDEYRSDGTTTETAWASCGCGKESETDAQGLTTEYQYDELNRLDFTSRELGTNNVITAYIYDAAGRKLSSITSADGIVPLISTNTYDLAGRMTWSRDNIGIETTYLYAGLTNITVRAGLTNTTVSYLDGRTHYTEQNGVEKSTYIYGPGDSQVAPGTQWTKVYTGPDGTNSPAWSKNTTDMFGRTIKTERPGFGDTQVTSESFYNDIGLLTNATMTGQADILYEYNELGQQIRTAQDINSNGTIDLAGPDRITESDSYFEEINSDYWMTSISKIYAQDNSSAVTTNSIRKKRLTGLSAAKTSESVSIDILGNQTTSTTSIDRPNKVRVGLVSIPDSIISSTNTTINGLQVSSTTKTGLEYTYAYDALGRRIGTTDPRTGESITHYNVKGQVDYTEDAATNKTSYAYDVDTGRRIAVTNALDEVTHSHYSTEGQLLGTYGNTYPVFYEYDAYDRMSAMYTLRDTNITVNSYSSFMNNTSSFDKTSWLYDAPTGLLTNKVYDDGKGPSYTYTSDGKLEAREWARGITTTYAYDDCCGSMTNITYSDSTPTVSFTYNRLGQQETISDTQGTRAFTYNDLLQLTHETIVVNGTTNVIVRTQDTIGRASGVALNDDYAVTYGFDNLGRFHSVSSSVDSVSSVVNYSYLENSSLISSITNLVNPVNLVREYEPNRNLITEVKNQFDNTVISQYNYINDKLGRRTKRIDTMITSTTNTFGYNSKSELIDAVMGLDDYGYNYDQIGNRITATSSVDSVTSEMEYLCNALNQYTNITSVTVETPTYDADGNMLTNGDWTYTWNGENRLITASNETTIVNFKYDYMGRRFEKSVEGGATNTFIYDGWNPIAEFSTGDVPSTNYFAWGLDLSGSLQGAGGIGGLLSTVQDGDIYFSCFDANGNITDYVDETGDIVAHYEYNPFGGITSATGDKKDDFNFRFSTKYLDTETALYYYGYRYYSSELDRWLNRDPIGENGGYNLYGFVDSNPINYVEYLGLKTITGTKDGTPFSEEFTLSANIRPSADCGKGKVHGTVSEVGGVDIWFDWNKGNDWDKCCICTVGLGWIQHVKDHNQWRFDNPNYDFFPGHPNFVPSDPSAPKQPNTPPVYWGKPGKPKSPFYGGGLPQTSIHDAPSNSAGDSFITQLVCPSSGEVLFSFTWRFTSLQFSDGNFVPIKLIYSDK